MIGIQVTISDQEAKAFLVHVAGTLTNRRGLNEALAIRLRRDLKAHFALKNQAPNKMGAPKSNFWSQVENATDILEITDAGATLQVAEQRFNIQLFGGTILPVKAKFLTIPLINHLVYDRFENELLSDLQLLCNEPCHVIADGKRKAFNEWLRDERAEEARCESSHATYLEKKYREDWMKRSYYDDGRMDREFDYWYEKKSLNDYFKS